MSFHPIAIGSAVFSLFLTVGWFYFNFINFNSFVNSTLYRLILGTTGQSGGQACRENLVV